MLSKKEQILKLLTKGEMVESQIAFSVLINQNYAKRYLKELKQEGKVKLREDTSEKITKRYWSLK